MNIKQFNDLPIGAKFRLVEPGDVFLYTKTGPYRYSAVDAAPIPNAVSRFNTISVNEEAAVIDLNSREVIVAEQVEEIYRIGKEIYDKRSFLITGRNELYVKVKLIETKRPDKVV